MNRWIMTVCGLAIWGVGLLGQGMVHASKGAPPPAYVTPVYSVRSFTGGMGAGLYGLTCGDLCLDVWAARLSIHCTEGQWLGERRSFEIQTPRNQTQVPYELIPQGKDALLKASTFMSEHKTGVRYAALDVEVRLRPSKIDVSYVIRAERTMRVRRRMGFQGSVHAAQGCRMTDWGYQAKMLYGKKMEKLTLIRDEAHFDPKKWHRQDYVQWVRLFKNGQDFGLRPNEGHGIWTFQNDGTLFMSPFYHLDLGGKRYVDIPAGTELRWGYSMFLESKPGGRQHLSSELQPKGNRTK